MKQCEQKQYERLRFASADGTRGVRQTSATDVAEESERRSGRERVMRCCGCMCAGWAMQEERNGVNRIEQRAQEEERIPRGFKDVCKCMREASSGRRKTGNSKGPKHEGSQNALCHRLGN